MELYTVTAGNRFFWQKLAVMAPDAETAAQSFRAYLAEPAQLKSEEHELKDAETIGYEEDYDRDSYRYRFDDDDVEEGDETELRRHFSGQLDAVRMIDSGGNG